MISKDVVRQLIEETKEIKLENVIERDKFKTALEFLFTDEILVISGVRRSGKSILIQQLLSKLRNKLKDENIVYINFEDERLIGLEAEDLEMIYQYFIEINNPKGKVYFFLDEIQEVKAWEKWVRRRYETKKIKFILTGSNASLLSSEFSTALTGRNITLNLHPFSFKEYLKMLKVNIDGNLYYSSKKPRIKSYFNDYLQFGGFPRTVLLDKKQKLVLLQQYFTNILYRDIVKRYEIRDVKGFEKFVVYLLTNISNPITYYSLRKIFKFSVDTIKEYLSYVQTSFIMHELAFFSYSLKEQTLKPRKFYCIDTGLRNAVSFQFSKDIGRLMENLVLIELLRKKKEVYYWKENKEVDFVVRERTKVKQLINVCVEANSKTKKREVNGLLEAMKQFKLNRGLIITENYLGEEKIKGRKIKYIPLWVWLLE